MSQLVDALDAYIAHSVEWRLALRSVHRSAYTEEMRMAAENREQLARNVVQALKDTGEFDAPTADDE